MVSVRCGSAHVPRIRPVMLETLHSCIFKEIFYLPEIFVTPFAAQARRTSESHPATFACPGVDDIDRIVYPPACQQRVAAHLDAFARSVINEFLEFCDIGRRCVFRVGSRTETEDDHLIAGLGALIHRLTDCPGIAGCQVKENGIFCRPRSHRPVKPSEKQPLPLPVIAVERHFVNAES